MVDARFPYLDRAPEPRAAGASATAHGNGGAAAARGANLIRVIHFARTHEQFFADQEVAGLLRAHWRSL